MKVFEDDGYIVFSNDDGHEFYDIPTTKNIEDMIYILEEKQWFTPEVKAQVESLLDV